jgi:hypothetical protein
MTRMTDCLVNYFGLDDERGVPTRYFCYHVVGGPGPTDAAGVAVITALAASHKDDQCLTCEGLHFVNTGGAAAAVAKALRHLGAYHEGDGLRKVQTPLRRFSAAGPEATNVELTSFWAV